MALKSIKDKITTIAGGEVLGEGNIDREKTKPNAKAQIILKSKKDTKTKSISKKNNKLKKNNVDANLKKPIKPKVSKSTINKPKISKPRISDIFNRKECIDDEIKEEKEFEIVSSPDKSKRSDEINIVKDYVEGYKDVLSILGIKEHLELDVDFKSNQLDYVEFTQTQPLGFDFDEVTDFISRVKYTMYKLESALSQRERDVVRIASEVKKVEEKMIAANQEKELSRMVGGMTQEELLIEENMELKVQVNELTMKLKNIANDSELTKKLNKQIEILQAENDILKMNSVENKISKLPSMNEIDDTESDSFGNMLNDIGGLYDE